MSSKELKADLKEYLYNHHFRIKSLKGGTKAGTLRGIKSFFQRKQIENGMIEEIEIIEIEKGEIVVLFCSKDDLSDELKGDNTGKLAFFFIKFGLMFIKSAHEEEEGIGRIVSQCFTDPADVLVDGVFLRKIKEMERVTRLRILFSQQISGIKGLSFVELSGEDVFLGIENLHKRHDRNLNFESIGPITNILTTNIEVDLYLGVRLINSSGISIVREVVDKLLSERKKEIGVVML